MHLQEPSSSRDTVGEPSTTQRLIYFLLENGLETLRENNEGVSQVRYDESQERTSSRTAYLFYLTLGSVAVIAIADMLMLPILKHFTERDISLLEFFLMLPKAEQKNCFHNCNRFAKTLTTAESEATRRKEEHMQRTRTRTIKIQSNVMAEEEKAEE